MPLLRAMRCSTRCLGLRACRYGLLYRGLHGLALGGHLELRLEVTSLLLLLSQEKRKVWDMVAIRRSMALTTRGHAGTAGSTRGWQVVGRGGSLRR
jgi:hypothetical protein